MVDQTAILTIELRQLRHVLSLSRLGNFRRAAQEQCITQPALTKSIQSLENKLDEKLFVRKPRGVFATESGKIVAQYAQKTIALLTDMIQALNKKKENDQVDIVVGTDSSVGEWLLNLSLENILKQSPELRIHTQRETADNLYQAIRDNRIHYAVITKSRIKNHLEYTKKKLISQSNVIYVRQGHPLEKQKSVSIAELLQYSFVGQALPNTMLSWLQEQRSINDMEINELTHIHSATQATSNVYISNTDCWGCCPLSMISTEVNNRLFSVLAVAGFQDSIEPFLISSKSKTSDSLHQFIENQIEQAGSLSTDQ